MTALMAVRTIARRPAWTPAELPTLSAWWDADDAATITVETGVSAWTDKSGNGRTAAQTTGSRQPALISGARNGRPALRFDAVNDFLRVGDVLDVLSGGYSAMAAAYQSEAVNGRILGKIVDTASTGEYALGDRGMFFYLDALRDARQATQVTEWQVVGAVLDRSAGLTSWRNGASVGTVTTGFPNTTSYNASAELFVGAGGNTTTQSSPWKGDIGEIVVSLAAWSDADRERVEGYLAHKWGLAGSLPAEHPYKGAAPTV